MLLPLGSELKWATGMCCNVPATPANQEPENYLVPATEKGSVDNVIGR
jgi:hypothetical protein